MLRIRSAGDKGTDIRGWMVVQQIAREHLVTGVNELHPLSFGSAVTFKGRRGEELRVQPRVEFRQCERGELEKEFKRIGVIEEVEGRRTGSFIVIAWAPEEYHDSIRAQIQGLEPASHFVVTLFPPKSAACDESVLPGGGESLLPGGAPSLLDRAPAGISKLEQLKWRKQQQASNAWDYAAIQAPVRGHIIGHARIKYVVKYQSCMV